MGKACLQGLGNQANFRSRWADDHPQPKGRKVVIMTLRELMEKVDKVPAGKAIPSAPMIMASGSPVIASESMGGGIEITVFQSGYCHYREDSKAAVFPVNDCGDYMDTDAMGEEHIFPIEDFMDQPWQVRIYIEGEHRISYNRDALRRYHKEISHDVYPADWKILSDQSAMDPLFLLIEEETYREEIDLLSRSLEELTDRQRYILMECIVKGRKQADVARELGKTRPTIADSLRRSRNKLRRVFGIVSPENVPNIGNARKARALKTS